MKTRPTRHGLSLPTFLLIASSVCMSVASQLLLRWAMRPLSELQGFELLLQAMSSSAVWIGLAAFGAGSICWLIVLSRLDLVVAYPLGSMNFVLIAVLSATILHESIPDSRWAGNALILLGILVIACGERPRISPSPES